MRTNIQCQKAQSAALNAKNDLRSTLEEIYVANKGCVIILLILILINFIIIISLTVGTKEKLSQLEEKTQHIYALLERTKKANSLVVADEQRAQKATKTIIDVLHCIHEVAHR